MALGDLDGVGGDDLFVVQTCAEDRDVRDLVLLDRPGWSYATGARVPRTDGGCGDLAATIDLDRDGTDEVIVMNGVRGPWGGIRARSRCSRRAGSPDAARVLLAPRRRERAGYQAWSPASIAAWPVQVCPDP